MEFVILEVMHLADAMRWFARSVRCKSVRIQELSTMPKAPRDNGSATPKKTTKSRKATPAKANGVHAESGNGNGNGNSVAAAPVTLSKEVIATSVAPLGVEEQIRARAYELYLQRGNNGGSPEQDWLRAVEEIRGRQQSA
jgi:Protein of unknown function (DUF2934)